MFLELQRRQGHIDYGGCPVFSPPSDAPQNFMREMVEDFWSTKAILAPWNLKLKSPDSLRNPLQSWIEDDAVEVDYHVRPSALPSPGDERELGILVSRLHSHPI